MTWYSTILFLIACFVGGLIVGYVAGKISRRYW